MRSRSLTRQIAGAVLLLELLCAFSFAALALWHERKTRLRAFDVQLQGRSDSLLGAVQDAEDPEDNVTIDPSELKLPDADVYAVYQQNGRYLGGSRNAAVDLIARHGDGYRDGRSGPGEYRILEREAMRIIDREENGGVGLKRPVTIVYAAPLRQVWHEIDEAATFYGLASVAFAGVTALMLLVFIRVFLRPLETLADAASSVSTQSFVFRAPQEALGLRELRPLAKAMEEVVARLASAFAKQHRFIGDAAHELKTAVAVVRSSIQLLDLRPRTCEQYKVGLQQILADNERTEELVSRMLTLARFEEPQKRSEASRLNLRDEATRVLSSLGAPALLAEVEVRSEMAADVFSRVSREAFHTLVSNLVMNAVQHSPKGAAVTVRVCAEQGDPALAVLEVEDHGSGIVAGDVPFVFDRFFRADDSRSRETGGAGLGLAICKSIVEAAGGEITLQSAVGAGTTVRATFMLT